MNDYYPKAVERLMEDHWTEVHAVNEAIGRFLGFVPQEEYCGGTENSYAYCPAQIGISWPAEQKVEVEKWLKELKERYGNTEYRLRRLEHWPAFHRDWNELMEALRRLRLRELFVLPIHPDIQLMWALVAHACGVPDVGSRQVFQIPATG